MRARSLRVRRRRGPERDGRGGKEGNQGPAGAHSEETTPGAGAGQMVPGPE